MVVHYHVVLERLGKRKQTFNLLLTVIKKLDSRLVHG